MESTAAGLQGFQCKTSPSMWLMVSQSPDSTETLYGLFFSFLLKNLEAELERGALPVWPGMSQTKVLRVQSNEKPLDEELWVWNDLASVLHNIYWPHFSLHVIYIYLQYICYISDILLSFICMIFPALEQGLRTNSAQGQPVSLAISLAVSLLLRLSL